MKKLSIIIALLLPIFCQAGDTVYVKNVYINNFSVPVKSGYIIHKKKNIWIVNGRKERLAYYKETD
ncbi:MAG TPA: hypothetical protein VN703_02935, partial [Candidatus Sulfopaludibacter sp.]|nr:hypothetical protein [Candidatus Sulfopaludibacter sp.]